MIWLDWMVLNDVALRDKPSVNQVISSTKHIEHRKHFFHPLLSVKKWLTSFNNKLFIYFFYQSVSKIEARASLLRKMKSMRSPDNGFESTTGKQMHFNKFQDVPPKYELVNLNVSFLFICHFLSYYTTDLHRSIKVYIIYTFILQQMSQWLEHMKRFLKF